MVPFVALLCLLITTVNGNTDGDYCEVLDEYDDFKVSMDKFLASRDEYDKFKTSLETFLASRDWYDNLKVSMDNFLASSDNTCKSKHIHRDCDSIKEEFPEATDGVYRIKPEEGKPSFLAYCEMTEDGRGWLVIQRRQDGSVDFYRTWFEYRDGFGNLTGEFWLGNEKIHRLTTQKQYELRIDLVDKSGNSKFAEYSNFLVGNMSEFYKLTIGGYSSSSTLTEELQYHNNMRFTARNLDLDTHNDVNCAQERHGAWWFKSCAHVHLNGLYSDSDKRGVYWKTYTLYKKTSMKIRPVR